jgi:hypothetical protein
LRADLKLALGEVRFISLWVFLTCLTQAFCLTGDFLLAGERRLVGDFLLAGIFFDNIKKEKKTRKKTN